MFKRLLFVFLMFLTFSNADLLRIQGGAGLWNSTISGDASYKAESYSLEKEYGITQSNSDFYGWVYFKHFIPLIPNIRYEFTNFETEGKGASSINFGNKSFSVNSDTFIKLNQQDIILYYNYLDNLIWMTLDLGVDLKIFNGEMSIKNPLNSEVADLTFYVPLGFARVRFEIPTTNIGIEADTKLIAIGDSSFSDTRAKIDYTFDTMIIKGGVEAGYRVQKLKIDDISGVDVKTDIKIDGFFAGVNIKF